jgi:uncharacterized Zn finger protein (UPF0148 family)
MMIENACPYCGGELPLPTRKRACPHCGKLIVVRTRPGKKPAWVREEDVPVISKEWADAILQRDLELQRKTGIQTLEIARHNIREWVKSGVVNSLRLHSAGDEHVCDACKELSGKVFPIETPEQINVVMANAQIKGCRNPSGCRCYWRPEEVTIA